MRGDVLISRSFRDGVDRNVVEGFRTQIIQKKLLSSAPVHQVGGCSFLHVKNENVYVVLACQTNANAILGFKFAHEMIRLFKSYFGGRLNVDAIKNNFVLIYELLDEIMDNGVPQVLTPSILKQYVLQQGTGVLSDGNGAAGGGDGGMHAAAAIKNATLQVTGAVGWRREGIVYKKNVVYLDVVEQVNLLTSSKGAILKADATGKVIMKTQLSGMPNLKLCVNDIGVMNSSSPSSPSSRSSSGSESGPGRSQVVQPQQRRPKQTIALDDVTFHQCVNLSQFQGDRIVSFTPPDGEFELMRYRVTDNLSLPFKVRESKLTARTDRHALSHTSRGR